METERAEPPHVTERNASSVRRAYLESSVAFDVGEGEGTSVLHAAAGRHCRSRSLLFGCFGDHGFSGDQEAGNGGGILQGATSSPK
jgi:hypothetical protein